MDLEKRIEKLEKRVATLEEQPQERLQVKERKIIEIDNLEKVIQKHHRTIRLIWISLLVLTITTFFIYKKYEHIIELINEIIDQIVRLMNSIH